MLSPKGIVSPCQWFPYAQRSASEGRLSDASWMIVGECRLKSFADYEPAAKGNAKADRPAKRISAAGNLCIPGLHKEVRK
jgi:hypothetical protein